MGEVPPSSRAATGEAPGTTKHARLPRIALVSCGRTRGVRTILVACVLGSSAAGRGATVTRVDAQPSRPAHAESKGDVAMNARRALSAVTLAGIGSAAVILGWAAPAVHAQSRGGQQQQQQSTDRDAGAGGIAAPRP